MAARASSMRSGVWTSPLVADALGRLGAHVPGHHRRRVPEAQIEHVVAQLEPHVGDVHEAFGRQHAGRGAATLDHGVGHERRAVDHGVDVGHGDAVLREHGGDAVEHGGRGVGRRRQPLVDRHGAPRLVEQREVGKRTADVDPDTIRHVRSPSASDPRPDPPIGFQFSLPVAGRQRRAVSLVKRGQPHGTGSGTSVSRIVWTTGPVPRRRFAVGDDGVSSSFSSRSPESARIPGPEKHTAWISRPNRMIAPSCEQRFGRDDRSSHWSPTGVHAVDTASGPEGRRRKGLELSRLLRYAPALRVTRRSQRLRGQPWP